MKPTLMPYEAIASATHSACSSKYIKPILMLYEAIASATRLTSLSRLFGGEELHKLGSGSFFFLSRLFGGEDSVTPRSCAK